MVGKRLPARGSLLMLAVLAILMVWPGAALAETFVVKNTKDKGNGSLRNAMAKANNNPGADEIRFGIPGGGTKTINLVTALPAITDAVTIDGYTQQGSGENTLAVGNNASLRIQLNGTNAGTEKSGFNIEAAGCTIKGVAINRFDGAGVVISGFTATNNRIEGNFIGTNANGTVARPNGDGVHLLFTRDNTVGGTAPEARNVISGNEGDGISGGGTGVFVRSGDDNRVVGNYVGTDRTGTEDLGNSGVGVGILAGDDNTIGGTAGGARNVISGNGDDGVHISGADAPNNDIAGNLVGTDAGGNGTLGNSGDGVSISQAGNTVGGTVSGAANRIAFNGGDGVSIPGSPTGVEILSNSIFSNGGLGIDLGNDGVTTNDPDDPDTGPNNRQNFPVISSARRFGNGITIVSGTLNGIPNQDFTVQCFLAAPDPSAHGEGRLLAGKDNVTTDADGDAGFACASPLPQPGQAVTATATKRVGNDTSEFSRIVSVVSGP